jgi:uncharacterized membrane protein
MNGRWVRRLQFTAACASIVVYAGLSHYCNSLGGPRALGAGLALAPPILFVVVAAWRWTSIPAAVVLTIALGALVQHFWPLLKKDFPLIYLLQDSCVYGLLFLTFARSLLPRRIPLCSQFADALHGPLTPAELSYTRKVTAAWSGFFLSITALSVVLYSWGPLRLWSIFMNFCVLPLVGGMFVTENWVRCRVLPQVHKAGFFATLRAYLATPQS